MIRLTTKAIAVTLTSVSLSVFAVQANAQTQINVNGSGNPIKLQSADGSTQASYLTGLRFKGQAKFTYFGFSVFNAKLWVASGFNPAAIGPSKLALGLTYLRDFEGSSIAEKSLSEIKRVPGVSSAQESKWLQAMKSTFPNVKKGDTLTGVNIPNQGAVFYKNGRLIGQINDPEFAKRFFGIWLAPTASDSSFRKALLSE